MRTSDQSVYLWWWKRGSVYLHTSEKPSRREKRDNHKKGEKRNPRYGKDHPKKRIG